jgi:hypothetical protein
VVVQWCYGGVTESVPAAECGPGLVGDDEVVHTITVTL